MKERWTYKKLGEICKIYTGKLDANAARENGLYPFFTCAVDIYKIDKYAYDCECVLVAGNGDLNVKYYKGKFNAYQRTYIIETIDKKTLDVKFLFWFMSWYIYILRKKSVGSTIKYIKLGNLTDATIKLFPLSEQQRIVKQLDEAFAEIDTIKAAAEKQLSEAKTLFQKALSKAMTPKEGWEEKKLGEVTIFSQGIQVDVNLQTELYSPGKVRFLRIIDVTQGNMPPRYIDDPGEKYHLKENEIAMVRYGTVGYVCYGYEGVIANNLFKITIKDKSKLQSNYLQYFLKSNLFQSHIRQGVGGAALPAIKFGDIKNVQLCLPPLSDQQRIVEELDELAENVKEIEKLNNKLAAECDAMKQALLRQVFE